MSTEACTLALRNALTEIKNVCPDITSTFVFEENGKIVSEDQEISEVAINNTQEAFRALSEKAEGVGGIESVSFNGSNSKANITRFNNFYVTNVASNRADEKTVTNLTRVMIPTMLRLVQDIYPLPQNNVQELKLTIEPESETETSNISEPAELIIPKPEASEFTVEILGFSKFLSDPHMVRIDAALIAQWKETYGDEPISQINIENPISRKTLRCEFNTIKESKYEGKGLIQLPERIQQAIETKKGEKVLLTPVLKSQEDPKGVMGKTEPEPEETKPGPKSKSSYDSQFSFTSAPQTQFIVENLKGLGFLGTTECLRLDNALISQWKELFGEKEITEVIVQEPVTGKRIKCRFQGIKDSNLEGKGVIQMTDKMQLALETKKGALVVVKPVVE
jgi:hypothetical protein